MTKCDYCGSRILISGVNVGGQRFCNDRCASAGQLMRASQGVASEVVERHVWEVHQGLCPVCKGRGPVDVHMGHQVWSAMVMTSWRACRGSPALVRDKAPGVGLCVPWWPGGGFPWGL